MSGPVTVLIPTHNRARALEAMFPSYLNDPSVEKIVVVDDGSTDDTADRVRQLANASTVPVELITHDRKRGQQAARMTAIAAAHTDWVLFGEDDVWISPSYCATLLEQASTLNADAIAGRLVTAVVPGAFSPEMLVDNTPISGEEEVFDMKMLAADFSLRPPTVVPAPHLHTIALIRRSVFDRVAFDTHYSGNGWREETDFYFGLNSAGGKVYFSPDAVCYHIRGPISARGGQRANRICLEYYAFRNTLYLVRKHWAYLSQCFGFTGSPLLWTMGYFGRRQIRHLARVLKRECGSTFKARAK